MVACGQSWTCAHCHLLLDAAYEIDHVVPLASGGDDTIENCVPLHAKCHREKTLREEAARVEQLRAARQLLPSGRVRKPPLECTLCQSIVSPYFLHVCAHDKSATFTSAARQNR